MHKLSQITISSLLKSINYCVEETSYHLQCLLVQQSRAHKPSRIILVNASPKTGTTWMVKMLVSIPGYLERGNFQHNFKQYLTVVPGNVIHGHDKYSLELKQIFQENGIQVITMLRDPRDLVVSHMFHIRRPNSGHPWHKQLSKLNEDDALMTCIEGHPAIETGQPSLPSIQDILLVSISWIDSPTPPILIKYEELFAKPVEKFTQVLEYLDISLPSAFIKTVVKRNRFERLTVDKHYWKPWVHSRNPGEEDQLSHFRKGIVGNWRFYFNEHHIHHFKDLAGQELIELGYEKDHNW